MTLTPEQIAEGWKLHDGSDVCPIKDERTKADVMNLFWMIQRCAPDGPAAQKWNWPKIRAYRIIEAHGADAAPARPTPYPNGYDELVWDADGWSQTIIVDGKRPEWLRDDDQVCANCGGEVYAYSAKILPASWIAIRVRRREPKRETVTGWLCHVPAHVGATRVRYDLIDGKPDLSTLKIAEDAL